MAQRPPDDNPFEMKGKRPPGDTEEGYQDTSIDNAERHFGMERGQAGLDPNQGAGAVGETSVSFDPYNVPPPLPPRV